MATTLNRTFFGGSTVPGSGVYPEDVKLLKVFANYAETDYDPLANSDTSVYIPTVDKHSHDDGNIVSIIDRVLAAGGSPIVTKLGAEFTYTSGDASTYKFVNVDGDNITEMTIDRNTGTVTTQNNFLARPVEVAYGVDTASHIATIINTNGRPYVKVGDVISRLYKIETNKYTFRTTHLRTDDDTNYLDIVDYIVNGSVWSTATKTISGGSSSQQAYLAKVKSSVDFDTTGHSGMHSVLSVNNVPADGIYQLSVMLHITPKTASATKSDLVFHFTSGDGTGWPNHTFHAVVDDSQTFAQQLSFSTSVSLKAGQNTLRIQCGDLNTEYLVFVDDLTIAGLIVGGQVVTSGTNIYPTLQDAISDASNLYVGDIFETNGFHTSGDGGAARYLVSDTGTANGMDIVQLATGKVAIFQWSDEVHPEQLGAFGDGITDDTSIFDYIINVFSSITRDMQVKRAIIGSFGNRYKVDNLYIHDCTLQRCVFVGLGYTVGIGLKLGSRAIIDRCVIFNFKDAIYTGDGDSAISAVVTGCTISWCGNGINLGTGTTQQTSVDNILIEKNYISRMGTLGHSSDSTPPSWDDTGCGIWLNGNWKGINIVDNVLEYNGYAGIRLQCDKIDLEPSCTITENYLEGNKFSAIRIQMQNRPCAVSIFGNQMTKSDVNVFISTGIFCTKMMSSGEVESPYGEFIGVATSNNGSSYISLNADNLYSSNILIYPSDVTNNTFELTPSKCSNSKSSRKIFHLDLYVSASAALGLRITYKDKDGVSQTSNVAVTENSTAVIEIPLININFYDSTNSPITCEITSSLQDLSYILITDMWIK